MDATRARRSEFELARARSSAAVARGMTEKRAHARIEYKETHGEFIPSGNHDRGKSPKRDMNMNGERRRANDGSGRRRASSRRSSSSIDRVFTKVHRDRCVLDRIATRCLLLLRLFFFFFLFFLFLFLFLFLGFFFFLFFFFFFFSFFLGVGVFRRRFRFHDVHLHRA